MGYEHPSIYKNIKRHSYNIDNLNKVHKAYTKMQELSTDELLKNPAATSTQHDLVKSELLGHLGNILTSAKQISRIISNNQSNVLVYCPDGSSLTSMMTSLAQLFLDPYYRTFEGFKVLVWKEWNYYLYDFCATGLLI